MKYQCNDKSQMVIVAMLLFSSAIHSNAACNAPPGETCTFTLSATDGNDSTRVASDGGTLKMVGVSRNATLSATPDSNATFDANKPSWSKNGTVVGSGTSYSHTGGTANYTAYALNTSKRV